MPCWGPRYVNAEHPMVLAHQACKAELVRSGIDEIYGKLRGPFVQLNHRGALWLLSGDQLCHSFYRRVLENLRNTDTDFERPVDFVNQAGDQQGMPAQFEEIVVNADLFYTKNFTPDARQRYFRRRA